MKEVTVDRFQNFLFLALLAFLLGHGSVLSAQQAYFNEWYTPESQYIKIKVSQDGIYRVTNAYLHSVGAHDLSSINASKGQVFYRGIEVPIFAQDSLSGALDFFEFMGFRNNGAIDSLLYRSNNPPFQNDPSRQPNLYTSFYSDTSAYFVTWSNMGTARYPTIFPQNYAAHTPQTAYRYRVLREYTDDFFEGGGGSFDINNVLNPDWVVGEGFLSREINPNDGQDQLSRRLYTWGHANNGSPNHVEARIMTVNNAPLHVTAVDLALQDRFIDTLQSIDIKTVAFNYVAPLDSNIFLRFHAYGTPGPVADKQRIAWCTLEYDRIFDLRDTSATILRHYLHTDTTYLRFYNADVNTEAHLYDPVQNLRIKGQVSGDTIRFLVPGSPAERTLYLFTDKAIQAPAIDVSPGFGNIGSDSAGAEFVIITHKKFRNSAQAYAAYRDSTSINRLSTKVVFIDEIYNEFGYGSMTPWAIKNFCRYTVENWPTKPKHFMIWGKGRNCPKVTCDPYENYIPTFGTPSNDFEYVTNFDREILDLVPKAGMGRVSIMDDAQGLIYLDKVREYENLPYAPWIKNALFMGGGNTQDQQGQIQSYLMGDTNQTTGSISIIGFNAYWEGEPLLGKVWSYQKRNNGFQTNSPMTTEQRINAGVGLLQYFGHSAVNIFELDLLEPNRYQNDRKYPLMLAFGCSGGNYYERQASYGERFILEPHKGGIGYVGNTTSGFLQQLGQYGQHFYPNAFQTHYGKSIGEVFQYALDSFCGNPNLHAYENIYAVNHAKQMNLQGDPSIAMHLPSKCDLRVSAEDIYFPDGFPGALDPQFHLNVVLHNDGRSFEDSFNVVVKHFLPVGATPAWMDTIRVGPFWNSDTMELTVTNTNGLLSAGYNTIEVSIDPADVIDEHYNTNNNTSTTQLFIGNIANPIIPPEYQIVGHSTVALIASTYQMLPSGPIHYSFEIDTTIAFDSPFKKTSPSIVGNSAIGEWPIPFAMTPGQVYYWRSRLTNTYPAQWSTSSFKYVPGQTGWSQSQMPQFLKDLGNGVHLDDVSREWEFDRLTQELHAYILSFGSPGKAAYFLGGYSSLGEAGNGVCFTPIDEKTLVPKINTTYGDWRFGSAPTPSAPRAAADVAATILAMEPGDYFLLVSSGNPSMPFWPDNLLQVFEQVGGNYAALRAIPDGDRLIFFGRKGAAPGSATLIAHPNLEVTGQPPMHDLDKPLSAPTGKGGITSTIIGPAKSWSNLNFNWNPLEPMSPDTSFVEVYGIRKDHSEKRLFTDFHASTRNLSDISADSFPNIRIVNQVRDQVLYTAPQLQKWEVYFQPVADLAVDANLALLLPDTLVEGQIAHMRFWVRNITSETMDSVLVRYSLQAADRSTVQLGDYRYKGFEAREIRQFNHSFQSGAIGLQQGFYTLIIEVNPDDDQPEQHHFNNFYYHRVWVTTDEVGPIVDVTIDGKHMISGDLVSPEPEIVIQINDENAYLPVVVSDSTYRIWFGTERSYRTNPMIRIENNDSVEAVPVRMPENKSRLIFRPGRLADGEYTLAVQGYDAKGNEAGGKPYTIQINVVSTKAISEVLPYPNPFSSACHFVYILTGDERPARFDIEIFTITGRLVKVVDLLALGEVHFGRNITDYAWDGRDEYGDLLANGVYLYRVNARFADHSHIDLRDEEDSQKKSISTYFNNGFGKMYLMR